MQDNRCANDFPSVLVVGAGPFSMLSGFGITISNLFKEWPADRLSCMHWGAEDGDPVCGTYYRLAPATPTADASGASASPRRRPGPKALMRQLIAASGAGGYLGRVRGDRHLAWVDSVDVDVVYGAPLCIGDIRLIMALAARKGCPYVIHLMDDWPGFLHASRQARDRWWGGVADRVLGQALRGAGAAVAIGEEMAAELSRRYGTPAVSFMNCPEPDVYAATPIAGRLDGPPYVLLFTGTVYDSCSAAGLALFAEAVDLLNEADPGTWVLRILEPGRVGRVAQGLAGRYRGVEVGVAPLDQVEVARLYSEAHGLALPFDNSPASRPARFSMPTKLPAYMLSGTPILIASPPDYACATYLRGADACLWLDPSAGVPGVVAGLKAFYGDAGRHGEVGARARRLALGELGADAVRPRFTGLMRAVARGEHPAGG